MDISSLLSSLSKEDMEKLKATAEQFFGDNSSKQEKNENNLPEKEGLFSFDPKLLSGVAGLSHMFSENDERSAFITALKPLLSEKRRQKADDAIMMLKFMRIINMLQENGR